MYRPRAFCKKITFVFILETAILPTNKHPPQIKTNLPQVKVKVTEQRSAPLKVRPSIVVGHFPAALPQAEILLTSLKTRGV